MTIKQIVSRSIADGAITGVKISTEDLTTSNIAEGTNLYFTDARVYSNVSQAGYITGAALDGYATNSQLSPYITSSSLTTANVLEVTNLYYTDARSYSNATTAGFATQTYVNTAVSNLVAAAPTTLDTLNELAAALGDDPNFATSTATLIGNAYNQANTATTNASTATTIGQNAFNQANVATTNASSAFNAANAKVATVAGVTSTSISNTNILDGIKTVDGAGSGLDADTLDGVQAASFAQLSGAAFTGSVSLGANTLISANASTIGRVDLGSRSSATTVNVAISSYFTVTATGSFTFTFSGAASGAVMQVLVIEMTNGGNYTITWPASVKWPADTAPTLTSGGTDLLIFLTDNNGTTWRGTSQLAYTT